MTPLTHAHFKHISIEAREFENHQPSHLIVLVGG